MGNGIDTDTLIAFDFQESVKVVAAVIRIYGGVFY